MGFTLGPHLAFLMRALVPRTCQRVLISDLGSDADSLTAPPQGDREKESKKRMPMQARKVQVARRAKAAVKAKATGKNFKGRKAYTK
ncbi:hypothetical protein CYMTET_36871 [Cymbomonas tetramitiformis]|uniref:Uncharacterized protein n=1 Tax=Cymbomonas tetramitiformis TaxID=36881 RepID=A0AAE0CGD1_9CHLO|nr:hypothetical protein CYMTET_36871 [Cymbomonas tetramitiformis]